MTRINLKQYRVCLESNGECVCKGNVDTVSKFLGISTSCLSNKCKRISQGLEKNGFRGRNKGYKVYCDENVLIEDKKICGMCKKKLPLSMFYIKSNADGKTYYNTLCKDCYNIRQKEVYQKKKDTSPAPKTTNSTNVIFATTRKEVDFEKLAIVDAYVKTLENQIESKLKMLKINDTQNLGVATINDIMKKINTCVNVATAGIIQFIAENGQAGLDACNERVRNSNISRF